MSTSPVPRRSVRGRGDRLGSDDEPVITPFVETGVTSGKRTGFVEGILDIIPTILGVETLGEFTGGLAEDLGGLVDSPVKGITIEDIFPTPIPESITDPEGTIIPEGAKIPPKLVTITDPETGKTVEKDFGDLTDADLAANPDVADIIITPGEEAIITPEEEVGEPFLLPFQQKKKLKKGRKSTLLTGGRGVTGKARTQKALLGGF